MIPFVPSTSHTNYHGRSDNCSVFCFFLMLPATLAFGFTTVITLSMDISRYHLPLVRVSQDGQNSTCKVIKPYEVKGESFLLSYVNLDGICYDSQLIAFKQDQVDPRNLSVGTLLPCYSMDFSPCYLPHPAGNFSETLGGEETDLDPSQEVNSSFQELPKVYVFLRSKVPFPVIGWLIFGSLILGLTLCSITCFSLSICSSGCSQHRRNYHSLN